MLHCPFELDLVQNWSRNPSFFRASLRQSSPLPFPPYSHVILSVYVCVCLSFPSLSLFPFLSLAWEVNDARSTHRGVKGERTLNKLDVGFQFPKTHYYFHPTIGLFSSEGPNATR